MGADRRRVDRLMDADDLEQLWRLLDRFIGDRAYWERHMKPFGDNWGAVVEAKRQVAIALTDAGRGDLVASSDG